MGIWEGRFAGDWRYQTVTDPTARLALVTAAYHTLADFGDLAHMVAMRGSEIKRLRERLGLSQSEFAEKFALALETVKRWEQGRGKPDRAACVLLSTIAHSPDAVDAAVAPTRGVNSQQDGR